MGGMAQLVGEKEFPTLSHEGERESIHICVNGLLLLMIVFEERYSLGAREAAYDQPAHGTRSRPGLHETSRKLIFDRAA